MPSDPSIKDSGLGPLIRLQPLPLDKLPSHPALASTTSTPGPEIHAFASAALEEANAFMTTYLPHHFTVKDSDKPSTPSTAHVKLLAHDITPAELPKETVAGAAPSAGETWFARESLHENRSIEGTASWEEFDRGLRVNHSQHEMEYTPDVQDAHLALTWDEQLEKLGRKVGDWEDVHAEVREMHHHIPFPMNNRVFTVMAITARKPAAPRQDGGATPGDSFVVVQVPVVAAGLPGAKYADMEKVTQGVYCSVERVELVEDGKRVQWSMATASDAKGNLPMWAQKKGVPGAVVKDVGFFVGWVAENRGKKV